MSNAQAVLVHLNGTDLADEVYRNFDLAALEDELEDRLRDDAVGVYDGNEYGPQDVTLFFYGRDAERLFEHLEGLLRSHPLCACARIEIRYGDVGAPSRKFSL